MYLHRYIYVNAFIHIYAALTAWGVRGVVFFVGVWGGHLRERTGGKVCIHLYTFINIYIYLRRPYRWGCRSGCSPCQRLGWRPEKDERTGQYVYIYYIYSKGFAESCRHAGLGLPCCPVTSRGSSGAAHGHAGEGYQVEARHQVRAHPLHNMGR